MTYDSQGFLEAWRYPLLPKGHMVLTMVDVALVKGIGLPSEPGNGSSDDWQG